MPQEANQFHPDVGHRLNLNPAGNHQLRLRCDDDDVTGHSALPSAPVAASAAGLVDPAPPNITNPFDDVVITVVQLRLKHLQIPNLQTRWSKGHLRGRRGHY